MKKQMKVVDLFAGAGGFSLGAKMAGAKVLFAANHWQAAVAVHEANIPEARHACQDLRQANWTELPDHDLLLASPCCQGHSRARGVERAHHDDARQTAWAVVDCVAVKRPRAIIVENVKEMMSWELFDLWKQALERYGYHLTLNVLNAADFGVPQSRERLFIVGSLDSKIEIQTPNRKHVAAAEIIDFKAGSWSKIAAPGRSARTIERIQAARQDFGDRFLIAYYGAEKTGRDLRKPLGTVTTRDRFALVDRDRMRMLTLDEYRLAMGFPESYRIETSRKMGIHLLGNAVCPPVAAEIIRQIGAAS